MGNRNSGASRRSAGGQSVDCSLYIYVRCIDPQRQASCCVAIISPASDTLPNHQSSLRNNEPEKSPVTCSGKQLCEPDHTTKVFLNTRHFLIIALRMLCGSGLPLCELLHSDTCPETRSRTHPKADAADNEIFPALFGISVPRSWSLFKV